MYLLKRSLCEDESQKDFEREEHWPLKISGKIFSEQNVAFLCFRDFWCTKGHLWECTTSCAPIYFFIFHFKALLILSLRRSDEKRAKSREAQKRETSNRARARYTRGKGKREREKVHVGFLVPFFFFFSSLRVLLLWLTFSLFFRPNLGAQIEALESFTKREIPQRYKI